MASVPNCLHCNVPARLTTGKEVYPHRRELHDKPIYICDKCGAYGGCHPNSKRPLGQPANKQTRRLRMFVHELLDPMWKRLSKSRRKRGRHIVYHWLGQQMGLERKQTHVGSFTEEQCRDALGFLRVMTTDLINAEIDYETAKQKPDGLQSPLSYVQPKKDMT